MEKLNLNFKINDVLNEIQFEEVYSQNSLIPRLMTIQYLSENEDIIPIYRHPIDKQPKQFPFSEITKTICNKIIQVLDHKYSFNHCLIQMYRNGADNIGRHSDKTLDIKNNSVIANYSIGATRCLRLINKETKNVKKFNLENDSLFILNLSDNEKYLHEIKKNVSNNAPRISFTFRDIDTFYDTKNKKVIGKGSLKYPHSNNIIEAFSKENKLNEFDYDTYYGCGFDETFF